MSIFDLWKLKKTADDLIAKLRGKKTWLGAIPLVLWVMIYAVPAIAPQYAWEATIGITIQNQLVSWGVDLNDPLLELGLGVTLVGLMDKLRRLFGKESS